MVYVVIETDGYDYTAINSIWATEERAKQEVQGLLKPEIRKVRNFYMSYQVESWVVEE